MGSVKGIIFNLVEEAVLAEHGRDAWDDVLAGAGVPGTYTSLGSYPDADLTALVTSGAALLGVDPGALTRHLGTGALLGLAERYPHFFSGHTRTRAFLATLTPVIHREVRKAHRDAEPPEFWLADGGGDDDLLVHYRSQRQLCLLAEGMILGAAQHFGEQVEISQDACTATGAEHCTLRVRGAGA